MLMGIVRAGCFCGGGGATCGAGASAKAIDARTTPPNREERVRVTFISELHEFARDDACDFATPRSAPVQRRRNARGVQ
jgi:hypothetical protein